MSAVVQQAYYGIWGLFGIAFRGCYCEWMTDTTAWELGSKMPFTWEKALSACAR